MVLRTFDGDGWDYSFLLYLEALGVLPLGLEALNLKTLGLKALDGLLPLSRIPVLAVAVRLLFVTRHTTRAINFALCTKTSAIRAFITEIAVGNQVRAAPVFNNIQYVSIVSLKIIQKQISEPE